MENLSFENMLLDGNVDAFNRWREKNPAQAPDLSGVSLEKVGSDSFALFLAAWFSVVTLCAWGGSWLIVLIGETKMEANRILIFTTTVTMLFLFIAMWVGYSITQERCHGLSLAKADFRFVSFRNANLRNADLTGADLTDADVFGADLRNVKITALQLARTKNIEDAFMDPGVLADVLALTTIRTLAETLTKKQ